MNNTKTDEDSIWLHKESKTEKPSLPVDNIVSQPGSDGSGRPGYLGWANGWNKDPAIYTHCKELRHQRQHYKIDNCQHMDTCEICGYWFKYDSSG